MEFSDRITGSDQSVCDIISMINLFQYVDDKSLCLQVNKLRFKDGKGDPRGFKAFLEQKNLPKKLLPRNRGNRLHIILR